MTWQLLCAGQSRSVGCARTLEWGERQAVLFDLGARRFYIFGNVLYPQDFIYLTGLLVISALSLFLFTAVAGRLWCGFSCPQTVYTEIFLWIERNVEGDRNARMVHPVGASAATAYVSGTGYAAQPVVPGNSSVYISTDAVHPSPAGARYIARRLSDDI